MIVYAELTVIETPSGPNNSEAKAVHACQAVCEHCSHTVEVDYREVDAHFEPTETPQSILRPLRRKAKRAALARLQETCPNDRKCNLCIPRSHPPGLNLFYHHPGDGKLYRLWMIRNRVYFVAGQIPPGPTPIRILPADDSPELRDSATAFKHWLNRRGYSSVAVLPLNHSLKLAVEHP